MSPDLQLFQQKQAARDFGVAVALGTIAGLGNEVKFGHVPDAGVARTDIWERGLAQAVYIYPATAGEAIEAVGVVGDTQEIVIPGLDVDGLPQSETITLNEATPVPIPGVWTAVDRAYNEDGTDFTGPVLIQGDGSTSSNIFAQMAADDQQTSQAIYKLPANRVGVIIETMTAVNRTSGLTLQAIFELRVAKPGKVFRTRIRYGLQNDGTSERRVRLAMPRVIAPGSGIKMTGTPTAAGTDMSAEFSLIKVDTAVITPDVLAAIIAS